MYTNNQNNRNLTSEELYYLLKKLGAVGNFDESKDEEFINLFSRLDGSFGNPADQQSMVNLTWLLLSLKVDIHNEENRKMIKEAVNNKMTSSVKNEEVKTDFSNEKLESYIRKIMFDLGFKSELSGFNPFKDAILYLLTTNEERWWTKIVYPKIGKQNNQSARQVERNLRHLIEVGSINHSDNEVSRYVWGEGYHLTVSECLCKVEEYIKQKSVNDILIELNEQYNQSSLITVKNTINTNKDNIEVERKINIDYVLNSLGLPKKLKGYNYLKDAINYILNSKESISWMELYSKLAEKNHTNGSAVERNIRHIRDIGLKKQLNNDIYKYVYHNQTNFHVSNFISTIIEYIKQSEKINSFNESNNQEYLISEIANNDISMSLEQRVSHTIHSLGIPTNIKGYHYLNYAVLYALREKQSVSGSNLYNEIADIYSDKYSRVERAIRHATSIWKDKYTILTKEEIKNIKISEVTKFLYNYGINYSNLEFIALVAEYIKLTSKEYKNEVCMQEINNQIAKKTRIK